MRPLLYSERARKDVEDILDYIAVQSSSAALALDFVNRLRGQCTELARLPGTLGRPRDEIIPGLRSRAYGSYVIFFRYGKDRLEVVRIIEGHRDLAGQPFEG